MEFDAPEVNPLAISSEFSEALVWIPGDEGYDVESAFFDITFNASSFDTLFGFDQLAAAAVVDNCTVCGLVHEHCGCHDSGRVASHESESEGPAIFEAEHKPIPIARSSRRTRRIASKSLYKRQYYLRERLRQWFMSETPIPAFDWAIIELTYSRESGVRIPTPRELRVARGFPIEGLPILSKDNIRSLLRNCDALNNEKRFLSKYLEKWLTIRWRFCGKATKANHGTNNLLQDICYAFSRAEQAFSKISHLKRKSFPSYNGVIARILELNGCAELTEDFPPMRTRRARKKFELYWWEICKQSQWPYLYKEKLLKQVKVAT